MTYEDLLLVPHKEGGRDDSGMDCYGLVLECCNRASTPLRDITRNAHVSGQELLEYVQRLNVEQIDCPIKGSVVQCEYSGELHIGYMIDKKRVLHMTSTGARVSPVTGLRNVKFYEVIN